MIEAAGAVPVIEHGLLAGEVAGLEVCRVVVDPGTGQARLEVGVGAHDREAFQLVHGDVPTVEALSSVVAAVAEHRRPGAPPHPLNRLGAERLSVVDQVSDPRLSREYFYVASDQLANTSTGRAVMWKVRGKKRPAAGSNSFNDF